MSRNSVFLKPPINQPPTTYHRPPTIDHLQTDHRPLNTDQPATNEMYWRPTNRTLTNKKSEDQKFYIYEVLLLIQNRGSEYLFFGRNVLLKR